MKAFTVKGVARVFCYTEPVSMACGFPRLQEMVEKKMNKVSTDGDLFLFHNKKADYVKVLYHDHHGFCLWAKRLKGARFDVDEMSGKLGLSEMEKLVNEVIILGGKRLPHLGKAA